MGTPFCRIMLLLVTEILLNLHSNPDLSFDLHVSPFTELEIRGFRMLPVSGWLMELVGCR
jgi:hypothetical protein